MQAPAYQEFAPPPRLAAWVECVWTARRGSVTGASSTAESARRVQRVAPDACMDVLFDLSGRSEPLVVGAMTSAHASADSGEAVDLLGVRFRPAGLTPFLGVEATSLVDETVDAQLVLASGGVPTSRLFEELADTPRALRPSLALRTLEQAYRRAAEPDPVVTRAAQQARLSGGVVTVDALAESVGVSARTLERRYRSTLGLTPKFTLRVERFRNAMDALLLPHANVSTAAYQTGYADQAHMTREFTALAGLPPRAWLDERTALT